MDLGLKDDQQMLRDTFARFFDDKSSMERVRLANEAGGFDRELWEGLAELGTFSMRIPEDAGGLGLGTVDAALVMEEAGRTLASGPLAEAIMAARLLGLLGGDAQSDLLEEVAAGAKVATLAYHDVAKRPMQWVAGGEKAEVAVARKGDAVVLVVLGGADRKAEANLASNGVAEVNLGAAAQTVLASGKEAVAAFEAAIEEWHLLCAAALNGIARQSVKLAAEYACERQAFGVPIGTYQAISHPLAELISAIEGGNLFVWKVIHEISSGADVGAKIPMALWFNATTASKAVIQSLRTFGGYGLTTEYDIFLYNLRAKAWPLTFGDPQQLLAKAGRRLYSGEKTVLPDVGNVDLDFGLGEEAGALAAEVDAFFEKTLTPELRAHAHHSWDGHEPEVHRKLAEAGLLFPELPPEKGGRGVSPYASHAAGKIWAKHGWSSHGKGTTMMTAAIMDQFGSDEVKEQVLKPVLAGKAVCSLGYSEPGSGSDVFAAQTKATPDGNGWRIDGTKMFTSGANLADYVLMLTRTNPDTPKHKGLTMFIVPLKAEGITIQPVYTFQDERTNITFYDGVRVPDSYRLGEVDKGIVAMSAALSLEHGGGFAEDEMEVIVAAEELCRQIDTDKGKLIDDPLAQVRLARCWANAFAGEMLGLRSLWSSREGKDLPAAGPMAKMWTTDRYLHDSSDLIDLTAPLSLSKREGAAYTVNIAYRYAHATTIWAGTSEIHRSMIAERALGLPRSRG
ncbi:MAG: acyl-CoA dehydrogenase [Sphingomonadaceae bacterium]|nr:acyl-CoA dehydrogenase [Sphingomonadaceae bacterium]